MHGNQQARDQLNKLINSARIILLEGPEGVGKSLAADEAAKLVADPVDIYSYKGDLTVSVVREIISVAGIRPFGSGAKVIIICCDKYTPEAANALLKLLEEPPETVIILLVSSVPFPVTVESRCKRVKFSAQTPEEVVEALVTVKFMARSVAERYAECGSVRKAIELYTKEQSRAVIHSFLKATQDGDWTLVFRVLGKWSDVDSDLLSAELQKWEVDRGGKTIVAALTVLESDVTPRLKAIVVAQLLMRLRKC